MAKSTGRYTNLTVAQKSDLIDLVHSMPCIWDSNCEDYKSSGIRQKAFNEIANKLSNGEFQILRKFKIR